METNIYTHTVQPEDIDPSGLSTIPAMYKQIINAIGLNIRKEGYGIDVMARRGLTWALARCGIEFRRRPVLYSDLSVEVWKGNEDALCHSRNVIIRDEKGEVIGCGVTDWCVLDRQSRRPVVSRLESPLEFQEVPCREPRRISRFSSENEFPGRASYCECDFNGHLNNCRYVEWFFNLLPEKLVALVRPVRLDINFKSEVTRGSDVLVSIKEMDDRQVNFCLKQSGNVSCLASLSLIS